MTDIVNEYFKQFYPNPVDPAKFEHDFGDARYTDYSGCSRTFPRMKLADGFTMSVQGHYGTYSSPRSDFADHYSTVEIGFPSEREELLMPYIDGDEETDPTTTVYGYVPIWTVLEVIKKHGGLIGPQSK